jgi:hypothetical protein
MNHEQVERFELLVRVNAFFEQRSPLFAKESIAHERIAVIRSVLQQLREHSRVQVAGIHGAKIETNNKTEALSQLKSLLTAIVRTSRAVTRSAPQFDEPFRLPKGKGDDALLDAARRFVAAATPASGVFIRYGLPLSFLDDLKSLIAQVEQNRATRASARASHKTATANIDDALQTGMTAFADLHVVVTNVFQNDAPAMGAWESLCRIRRARRKRAAAAGASEPPVAAADNP